MIPLDYVLAALGGLLVGIVMAHLGAWVRLGTAERRNPRCFLGEMSV